MTMHNGINSFNPNVYASLMFSFRTTVAAFCKSLGFHVEEVDDRLSLWERCSHFDILGYNANAMCHPYKMYNDTRTVNQECSNGISSLKRISEVCKKNNSTWIIFQTYGFFQTSPTENILCSNLDFVCGKNIPKI